jgi:tetratricopeptide (TPR) repeat protein
MLSRMTAFGRWSLSFIIGLGLSCGAALARAAEPESDSQAQAQQHFKSARELYQSGAYRDALAELETARELDPAAKDLVFNLGVVNERLGRIDAALEHLHHYLEMNVTAQERVRAESFIRRLEGAKREVEQPPAAPPPSAPSTPLPPPPPPPPRPPPVEKPPERGRVDGATVTTASLAVAGLGVGSVFGIKALSDRPASGTLTSDYAALAHQNDGAHTEAIIADIGFSVGVAAAVVTAYLYFSRLKSASPPRPSTRTTAWATAAIRGGVVGVMGRF